MLIKAYINTIGFCFALYLKFVNAIIQMINIAGDANSPREKYAPGDNPLPVINATIKATEDGHHGEKMPIQVIPM